MKTTVLPSLEGVLAGNTGMLSLIKQKTKITTTTELLLFSERMILMAPGLGGSVVVYVVDRLKMHDLALRGAHVPINTAVNRLFGSVEAAPFEVLNFTYSTSGKLLHRPLKAFDLIRENVLEDVRTVKDLEMLPFSASVFSEVDDLRKLMDRLDEWGIDKG